MATKDSAGREGLPHKLHVYFVPLASPGHIIPMLDIAKLFASHGVDATVILTPLNAARFANTLTPRADESGHRLRFHLLRFPCSEAGLPDGCESTDTLPTRSMSVNFARATAMLQTQFDRLVRAHPPDAIVSDSCLPWTAITAREHGIPRFTFPGTGCFALSVERNILLDQPHKVAASDSDPFLVPGLPDRVQLTRVKLSQTTLPGTEEFFEGAREADMSTEGMVVNSFMEMEPGYMEHYERVTGKRVWAVGPVSLCDPDKAERGGKAGIDEAELLGWLDSKPVGSVIYVCFGSLCRFPPAQLREIAVGLEGSHVMFVWVIREGEGEEWVEELKRRVEGRGLVIRGWAPQVMVLGHVAVGGFMTHCGWNSTVEGVSAGVAMLTWPMFGEQFYNERLVVDVLRVGVGVGAERGFVWGEEERGGVVVRAETVAERVRWLMGGGGGGEEVEQIRRRVREMGENARRAMEVGGTSYLSMKLLIEYIVYQKQMKMGERGV